MIAHHHTCCYCGLTVDCYNPSCTEDDICTGCQNEMLDLLELEMQEPEMWSE